MGGSGSYTNDERTLQLIQPVNATSIVLNVDEFDIEAGWDYLYIYDGNTVYDPVIGIYDGTTIPSTININGSAVLVEFRTDCATTSAGFDISWNAIVTNVNNFAENSFKVYPNPTNHELKIQFNSFRTGRVVISDITGKKVLVKRYDSANNLSISVDDLANGIYFLKIGSKVVKFVKD